jgi:hypothetical protein
VHLEFQRAVPRAGEAGLGRRTGGTAAVGAAGGTDERHAEEIDDFDVHHTKFLSFALVLRSALIVDRHRRHIGDNPNE